MNDDNDLETFLPRSTSFLVGVAALIASIWILAYAMDRSKHRVQQAQEHKIDR